MLALKNLLDFHKYQTSSNPSLQYRLNLRNKRVTRASKVKNSGCYEISTAKTKMFHKNSKNCKKKSKLLAWKGMNLKLKLMRKKLSLNS